MRDLDSTGVVSAFRQNVSTGVASAFRRNWLLLTVFRLLAAAATAGAQDQPLAFAPPAAGIAVTTNVEYAVSGDAHLAMDVYTPPVAAPGGPALVFFNRGTGESRRTRLYDGWARAAASQGIVGVLADL